MKRRGRLIMKVVRLKTMGFLCGVGIFVGTAALAGGDAVLSQWDIEHIIIPLMIVILSGAAWFIRQIDRRLSDLNRNVGRIAQRISHIEGKLDISQTGGNVE